jgi:hypothetical protein
VFAAAVAARGRLCIPKSGLGAETVGAKAAEMMKDGRSVEKVMEAKGRRESQVWWFKPVNLLLGRQRSGGLQFRASPGKKKCIRSHLNQ